MGNSIVQVRVDEQTKQKLDKLFADLGFDTPTAVRMFFAQVLKFHGLPFAVKQPDNYAETLEAMDEIEEHIKSKKGNTFKSVDELFEELEK